MRQAIVTKYLGPTNHRGSRVKATAQAGSITIHWDDALDVSANHARAALALAKKFGWAVGALDRFHVGALPNNCGYCFVIDGCLRDELQGVKL
jgi:hypothetical protein